ncbi:MAG: imidazole glycerol phosphate synthase subunit HisH [Gemmatimonadota bacterium]
MKASLFDYGVGNLHSLGKALEASGATVHITSDAASALEADCLILPGVGAFGPAAEAMSEGRNQLRAALAEGFPCLGICLGMQLLFEASAEAPGDGLGVVAGRVERIDAPVVPHMGWNDVRPTRDVLFEGLTATPMYFANSYHCVPSDPNAAIGRSTYADTEMVTSIRVGNSWGVQFHPEKSSDAGRALLANFIGAVRRLRGGAP